MSYHNVLKTLRRKLNHAHVVTTIEHNIKLNQQQYLTVFFYKYEGASTLSYNKVTLPISRGKAGLFYAKGEGQITSIERISFVEMKYKRYGYYNTQNLVSDLLDLGVSL